MKRNFSRSALVGVLLATTSSVAFADLDEIVITAEKRESNLQNTAIAISAFGSDTMEDLGINGAADIANFTPGMSFSNQRIAIRGIGRLTQELGTEPGVATYQDGIYTSATNAVGAAPFLIDRIEVLRGPQGTLYGRNSIGGAANVIFKRPTEEFEGDFRLGYASFNQKSGGIRISGPLSEKVGYLLSASGTKNDGYIENRSGHNLGITDNYYVDTQIEWQVNDRLNIWLKQYAFHNMASGPASSLWPGILFSEYASTPSAVVPGDPSGLGAWAYGSLNPNPWAGYGVSNPTAKDPWTVDYNDPGYQETKNSFGTTAHVTYELDNVIIKYVGGYNQYDYNEHATDWDKTSREDARYFIEIKENKDWYQHEVQLISNNDSPLQYIFGVFNFWERIYQPFTQLDPFNPRITNPYGGPANPDGIVYHQAGWLETESIAFYSQLDYDFNEAWHMSGGLRWGKDRKTGLEEQSLVFDDLLWGTGWICAGPSPCAFDITAMGGSTADPARISKKDEWDGWTGRFEIDYRPNDNLMYYATVGSGWKAGGFKLGSLTDDRTKEETVLTVEAGLKATFNDNLRTNFAIFHNGYDDAQTPISFFENGVRHTVLDNAKEARSYGLEFEMDWQATENLFIKAAYGYLNTEIVEMGRVVQDQTEPGYFDLTDITEHGYSEYMGFGTDIPTVASYNAGLPGCPLTSSFGGPCWVFLPAIDSEGNVVNLTPQSLVTPGFESKVDGNSLVQAPENKLTISALYTFFMEQGKLQLGTTMAYTDKQYYTIFNDADTTAPATTRWDFRASWLNTDESYRFSLWVRNAFDEEIYSGLNRADELHHNYVSGGIAPPRMIGADIQILF